MDSNPKPSFTLTSRNIIRMLAIFCIIFVFCPTFLVSCSGVDVEVSAMKVVGGISSKDVGEISEPKPILIICLLIPLAILAVTFAKQLADKHASIAIAACALVDFVVWLIFRSKVRETALTAQCSFESTIWFFLNMLTLLLLILLPAAVIVEYTRLDDNFIDAFTSTKAKNAMNQISSAASQAASSVSQMASNAVASIQSRTAKVDAIGYCQKCGAAIPYGNKFCISCGTPVPESLLAEAEAAKKAEAEAKAAEIARTAEAARAAEIAKEEEAAKAAEAVRAAEAAKAAQAQDAKAGAGASGYCKQCGAPLSKGSAFCSECGTPVRAKEAANAEPAEAVAESSVTAETAGAAADETPTETVQTWEEHAEAASIPDAVPKPERTAPKAATAQSQATNPTPMPRPMPMSSAQVRITVQPGTYNFPQPTQIPSGNDGAGGRKQ